MNGTFMNSAVKMAFNLPRGAVTIFFDRETFANDKQHSDTEKQNIVTLMAIDQDDEWED